MKKTYAAVLASTGAALAVTTVAAVAAAPTQAAVAPSTSKTTTTFTIEAHGYFAGKGKYVLSAPILGGTVTNGQGQMAIDIPANRYQPGEIVAFHVTNASATDGHFTATLTSFGSRSMGTVQASINGSNWSYTGTGTGYDGQPMPITGLTIQS